MRHTRQSLIALLLGSLTVPLEAAETRPPNYSGYKSCYRLPYGNLKPVDFDKLASMSVRVSLNGGPPLRLQIDTGSVGVVVGAADVPNIDPNGRPGSITYSSSGVELDGVWTPVTITFPDAKDDHGNIATAVVPVLAVAERKIHPGAVNSGKFKPTKDPRVFMFGVGSGRGKEVHQERNPWLNLKEMQAGAMRRGYMLTREGITLGLTTAAVGRGYVFEKLQEHLPAPGSPPAATNAPKDWDSSQGWVVVGGKRQVTSGMLLDTGLTNMMIELPEVNAASDVAEGTEVDVFLLSGRLNYRFTVGDTKNPAAPRKVSWTRRSTGPLVNTGLRALANFDYLYDADGGYLGLRPTRKQP